MKMIKGWLPIPNIADDPSILNDKDDFVLIINQADIPLAGLVEVSIDLNVYELYAVEMLGKNTGEKILPSAGKFRRIGSAPDDKTDRKITLQL